MESEMCVNVKVISDKVQPGPQRLVRVFHYCLAFPEIIFTLLIYTAASAIAVFRLVDNMRQLLY